MPSGERELWVQEEIFLSVAMDRGEQICEETSGRQET